MQYIVKSVLQFVVRRVEQRNFMQQILNSQCTKFKSMHYFGTAFRTPKCTVNIFSYVLIGCAKTELWHFQSCELPPSNPRMPNRLNKKAV